MKYDTNFLLDSNQNLILIEDDFQQLVNEGIITEEEKKSIFNDADKYAKDQISMIFKDINKMIEPMIKDSILNLSDGKVTLEELFQVAAEEPATEETVEETTPLQIAASKISKKFNIF